MKNSMKKNKNIKELEKLSIEEDSIRHEIVMMPCGQFSDKKDLQDQMIPTESQALEQRWH
jgi:hypothetical protein